MSDKVSLVLMRGKYPGPRSMHLTLGSLRLLKRIFSDKDTK